MKLSKLKLENFRGIKSLELPFDDQLTLITGSNGAGKTSILKAITLLLSWVIARTKNTKSPGKNITEQDINNSTNDAVISASTTASLHWSLAKTRPARKVQRVSDIAQIKPFVNALRDALSDSQCAIPLFCYYPVNRAVGDIALKVEKNQKFDQLDAWQDALTGNANFKRFFSWFRQREDLENENRAYLDSPNKPQGWEFPDRQLTAVRQALTQFLPEFTDFKVRRNPLRMTAFKNGEELNVEQLSDGEKCMISLTGDLARRLAIANPIGDNPLAGEGVILIDEFDLHLHPQWQRRMIRQLPQVFTQCQFIVTTHSPQALGEVQAEQLRVLHRDDDNQVCLTQPKQSYGLTSNQVLNEIMLIDGQDMQLTRTPEVEQALNTLFDLIEDEKIEQAQATIDGLEEQLNGEIPELLRAKMRLELQS
ncbi:MAG: AAA family ATPase [Algicola sp.]|nr:AAA family ATPase [Algicola sp.]